MSTNWDLRCTVFLAEVSVVNCEGVSDDVDEMSPRKKHKRKPLHFANNSTLAVELECGLMCEEAQHESIFARHHCT